MFKKRKQDKFKYKIFFIFKFINLILIIIFFRLFRDSKFKAKESKLLMLNGEFINLIDKFKYLLKNESHISEDSPIWVMVYNGIEKESLIINACIKSIIANAGNHPVFLLDKNNYSKYISLPPLILEKFHKKMFNSFHLCEIIKFGLLYECGGYWIDSSYFLTSPISSINSSLFTLKLKSSKCINKINKCLWDKNFLASSKHSFFAAYSFNAIINYWNKYNFLIDDSLIDYIIYFAYTNERQFKNIVDTIPFINCNIYLLGNELNTDFHKKFFNCPFNKLEKIVNEKVYNISKTNNYRYVIETNKYIEYNLNQDEFKSINNKKYDFGIIGLWYGENYGSISTYYALHQTIKKMGYSILMISNPLGHTERKNLDKSSPYKFGELFYNISEKKSLDKLKEFNKVCKGFLVGSDQLWNVGLSRPYKQMYFLGFADDDCKKISYGTSFGKPYKGTKEEKKISISNLRRFNKISVRDELSYDICKNNFGLKDITQVCDPTLLCDLSDYEALVNISKVKESEPYLLAYILDPNSEIGHRLEKLSVDKNMKIIIIFDKPHKKFQINKKKINLTGKGNIVIKENIDILDWMWYYNHAKSVFTDSFHGTIFSIIFKKPFITLKNEKRGSERFISLLKPLGLIHRLFDEEDCITNNSYLFDRCEYDIPYKRLEKIKEKSYLWLENALK